MPDPLALGRVEPGRGLGQGRRGDRGQQALGGQELQRRRVLGEEHVGRRARALGHDLVRQDVLVVRADVDRDAGLLLEAVDQGLRGLDVLPAVEGDAAFGAGGRGRPSPASRQRADRRRPAPCRGRAPGPGRRRSWCRSGTVAPDRAPHGATPGHASFTRWSSFLMRVTFAAWSLPVGLHQGAVGGDQLGQVGVQGMVRGVDVPERLDLAQGVPDRIGVRIGTVREDPVQLLAERGRGLRHVQRPRLRCRSWPPTGGRRRSPTPTPHGVAARDPSRTIPCRHLVLDHAVYPLLRRTLRHP